MSFFESGGMSLHFERFGAGQPIIAVHGFASNLQVNWVDTGWVDVLTEAGFEVIALDNRGHGQSEKSYNRADYPAALMAGDVICLAGHLGLTDVALIGYSMGARICAFAALSAPSVVKAAIFGGMGINMVRGAGDPAPIIKALEAPSLADVADPVGRAFRAFSEQTRSDLRALAACMSSSRQRLGSEALGTLRMPVLVAVGSRDEIGGDPAALAALIPAGEALVIDGCDHMRATGDRRFKQGVLEFLARNFPDRKLLA